MPAALPPGTDRDAYGEQVRMNLAGITTLPPKAGYQLFAPGIDTFLKEHLFADIPVVMFYPGTFNGQTLSLFDEFVDGNYYRAFNLL